MNPFQVVKDFEQAMAEYAGAPYAVAVNSCTMALLLAVTWHLRRYDTSSPDEREQPRWRGLPFIEIPKRTYVSVPMSIIHAGGQPTFRDEEWLGAYRLKPLPVWDSARWFTSGLYWLLGRRDEKSNDAITRAPGTMACVSFHASKTLGFNQGGAILHDDAEADAWFRRARFDGRSEGVAPKDDTFHMLGWHCYMSPDVAAGLLLRLHSLPQHNEPLPNDDYPDLSTMEIFK